MAATINVTSRNLTDVFILMRNNSLQTKNIFSDQILDDKVALVSSRELENGHAFSRSLDLPPIWVEGIEHVQYEMSRINQKLQELKALHEKTVTRPSFDDSVHEEKEIENISQEITRMFHHCHKIIHQIRERSRGSTSQEYQVSQNVLSSLVSSLQELSTKFHSAQSEHLRQLRSREEKSQQFFNSPFLQQNNDSSVFDALQEESFNQSFLSASDQQVMIQSNNIMVEQREREIRQIVKSISELNDIFKDLAFMVAEQGTVLDRIDYNLEQVQTQVSSGLKHLTRAQTYHKKNRKIVWIMFLAAACVVLMIMLVIFKL
ncbi:syntaxin-16 [Parasteatoda tepidariorum]|uniref:syntaxin-16 n=1 Tax=Parasteatoda tepidariorum TaxID=114398 RepID=UPI00077FA291|nr:syntaxin-16 [Parasteatoda tepidariorum]